MAKKKKQKKPLLSPGFKLFLIILLIPISITVYYSSFIVWQQLKDLTIFKEVSTALNEEDIQKEFDVEIPEEYIPIYIAAGELYDVPWTLLAAHHRVETRFSTTSTLISPVGAEGHMQFMPCTFVGWKHPTCDGLGQGQIPEEDKTNPAIIKKFGGYGVDGDGDGKADPFDIEDAIYSAANYLSKAGASDGKLRKAVFNYNHSDVYVDMVISYYEQYESVSSELEKIVLNTTF
ncbi:membrane protein [Ureibacillus massiliensis 4400831 = CIP 108448 = CCUG 49529]|uniref:Membrane protein n=1 Tax=Ureibacillus massiliensis 4400831 = CIP 108448 = CCUG 49529 TaxID=1211035 RepID=A0A0A3J001_9BACL|nr:lytic transglycosylase domain-containing protein [Ureibacillus massiliensis]KGR90324.1 membrane protein [Ureibacillus massiliensis 4400831 = CIP 108448 = CCUG 49529]